jgi:hypothetical protein
MDDNCKTIWGIWIWPIATISILVSSFTFFFLQVAPNSCHLTNSIAMSHRCCVQYMTSFNSSHAHIHSTHPWRRRYLNRWSLQAVIISQSPGCVVLCSALVLLLHHTACKTQKRGKHTKISHTSGFFRIFKTYEFSGTLDTGTKSLSHRMTGRSLSMTGR